MQCRDGNYLDLLQKAYETIKTESARAAYEEEWQEIQKQKEQNQYKKNKYEQNRYEQNLYGQNLYGQNLYGQNRYEQNQYGQNRYEQNRYEQNQYGQNRYEQNQHRQNQYEQNQHRQNQYKQNQQVEVANSEPIVQQSQSKHEIQFTPIMTESSKQKTQMRINVVNGKQTYTGPEMTMITLTKPTIEENQESSKNDIQFMPMMTDSSRQRIQEQQVKKIQQTQPAKESLLKKVLGMVNNEKVNANDLIQEVKEDAKDSKINKQQENVVDRADEDEDMQL